MHIAHVALWTLDLERAADFWRRVFNATIGQPYHSQTNKGFVSRFVTLSEGPTIELMTHPSVNKDVSSSPPLTGWAHIAISLGSEEAVKKLAEHMKDEHALVSAPRWTGDGFFEAVIQDPDGNLIEITA
ncbi:bleomycin resistance protein [Pseudomonas asuensis]|uniref:Bleomycin resistance protein n=1 Tax=Pseudomonas asuensis TaxID=1825787 RepID=A0ABQ2GX59_9PSED|nr:VOC family protein [Pseudomonas asuensis]GGM18212.1 bleomycin resistance protein [Pseudomonas asuensis]